MTTHHLGPIVLVAGTRPEIIKLAAVFRAFERRGEPVELWLTEQHRGLADEQVRFFGLPVARRLDAQVDGQSSSVLLARLLERLDRALAESAPRAVLVQGDTTSALAGAIAAFHRGIPVGHVEAGLRSGTLVEPFPEEMNRRAIDVMASWHFPPTPLAAEALRSEGRHGACPPTGNTGIDALHWAVERVRTSGHWPSGVSIPAEGARLVLSTAHRRESLGAPLQILLEALGQFVEAHPEMHLVHIAHPNPAATQVAQSALLGRQRVSVIPPVDFPGLVALMDRADVIVTDSGGIQEEGPSFGKPILVTRNVTERPEVLECGGVLVGTDPARMVAALREALTCAEPTTGRPMRSTPFGDGRASERIAEHVLASLASTASS